VNRGERLKGQGAKPLIKSPYEHHILVDVVEKGKGAQMALLLLNEFRSIKGLDYVGRRQHHQTAQTCDMKNAQK
jgi:hypothetical protein